MVQTSVDLLLLVLFHRHYLFKRFIFRLLLLYINDIIFFVAVVSKGHITLQDTKRVVQSIGHSEFASKYNGGYRRFFQYDAYIVITFQVFHDFSKWLLFETEQSLPPTIDVVVLNFAHNQLSIFQGGLIVGQEY